MAEQIVNISPVNPVTFELQTYSNEDASLISSVPANVTFNPSEDYLEYFLLDLNKTILDNNVAGYPNYSLIDNIVTVDPKKDVENSGFFEGSYYVLYNFLKRKLSSSAGSTFYIQDISPDRTEIRLNTTTISSTDIIELTSIFEGEIVGSSYYLDFYLNFGNNRLIIANNILLDLSNGLGDPTVLIKLYEPLPLEFNLQSRCWVVEKVAESRAFQVDISTVFETTEIHPYIAGPNFNLPIQDQINNSTPYYNQNTLSQNTSLLGSGSLLYQINSLLAEKGIEINIDYSDYSQFVHFSSAQTRLENFYYKLSLIEEYTRNIGYLNTVQTNSFIATNQTLWNNKIDEIITNFDGYEYYLYYSSESHAWPKVNSTFPYVNYHTTSSTALNWFASQSFSASYYDSENKDYLLNAIPTYLREDDDNNQYFLFVQMIGQHFDSVWVYLKDITNKFDADNRLDYGISKDIVAQAIRDLGVKIYQNNFSSGDLYSALLGVTNSGSLLNIPNITGSLPVPTGSGFEYINTVITASSPNALEPLDDINKEIYKRIYHNLPALLKRKGTPEAIRMLLDIYGIPDTIVRINEFGGIQNNSTENNWNNFVDQFNYEFFTTSSGYVNVPLTIFTGSGLGLYGSASYGLDYYGGDSFNQGTTSSFTIEFRFKTTGIPEDTGSYNQILAYAPENNFALVLEYTGSGYTSGSYSGSIPDPYNTWGTLKFIDLSSSISSSVYLPFFNGEWWSVMYNLGDFYNNWILETGNWDDGGYWWDNEIWID